MSADELPRPSSDRTRSTLRLVTPPEPNLDPALQTMIGEQLRSYYAALLSEPVPDRFVALVNRLDRKH
jgi:hypothetical protein